MFLFYYSLNVLWDGGAPGQVCHRFLPPGVTLPSEAARAEQHHTRKATKQHFWWVRDFWEPPWVHEKTLREGTKGRILGPSFGPLLLLDFFFSFFHLFLILFRFPLFRSCFSLSCFLFFVEFYNFSFKRFKNNNNCFYFSFMFLIFFHFFMFSFWRSPLSTKTWRFSFFEKSGVSRTSEHSKKGEMQKMQKHGKTMKK